MSNVNNEKSLVKRVVVQTGEQTTEELTVLGYDVQVIGFGIVATKAANETGEHNPDEVLPPRPKLPRFLGRPEFVADI